MDGNLNPSIPDFGDKVPVPPSMLLLVPVLANNKHN